MICCDKFLEEILLVKGAMIKELFDGFYLKAEGWRVEYRGRVEEYFHGNAPETPNIVFKQPWNRDLNGLFFSFIVLRIIHAQQLRAIISLFVSVVIIKAVCIGILSKDVYCEGRQIHISLII